MRTIFYGADLCAALSYDYKFCLISAAALGTAILISFIKSKLLKIAAKRTLRQKNSAKTASRKNKNAEDTL